MADWYLYVIETDGARLYTGITTDVERRLSEHASGKGARFMRGRKLCRLRHQQKIGNRSLASKVEYAFKQLKRAEKLRWLDQGQLRFDPQSGKLLAASTDQAGQHSETDSVMTPDPN